jgi:FKBP-type peptidyl-prolyl cis-trans isomerase FklB
MKAVSIYLCGLMFVACYAWGGEGAELKTDKDKLSYGIGVSIAKNFRKQGTEVDLDLMMAGIKSMMAGERLLMTEKELRNVLNKYQSEVRQSALLSRREAIVENKRKSEAFLAQNKQDASVVALPSGVQYKMVTAGTGRVPLDSDIVKVSYRGTLLDGTEFDATEVGQSADLKVSALVTGWREAMKLMPAGSQWRVFIPPQLAYGERGVGSDIGPNELLIFDIELIAIK